MVPVIRPAMEENSLDRQALIALNLLPGFGPRTFLKLREGGGGYARASAASAAGS